MKTCLYITVVFGVLGAPINYYCDKNKFNKIILVVQTILLLMMIYVLEF
jgi:hypothetical protein